MVGNVLIITFYPTVGLTNPDQLAFEDFGYYVQNSQGQRLQSFEVENGLIDESVKSGNELERLAESEDSGESSNLQIILIDYLLAGNSTSIENMTAYHGLYLSAGY